MQNTLFMPASSLSDYTVGILDFLNHLESNISSYSSRRNLNTNYPPHNVVKLPGGKILISLALAGFKKEDLHLDLIQNREFQTLTITTKYESLKEDTEFLYRGIAKRHFTKVFEISNQYELIDRSLKDGILNIEFKLKQEYEPKVYSINLDEELPMLTSIDQAALSYEEEEKKEEAA